MKRRSFNLEALVNKTSGNYAVGNMRRILLVMSKHRQRIFGAGRAVWVRRRAQCRLADRTAIHKKGRVFSELKVISAGQFHHEVVWVLTINDRQSVCSFAGLEELRVTSLSHSPGLQTEHGSER